jgi:hypothetical protein
MSADAGRHRGPQERAVLVAAGLADVTLGAVRTAVGTAVGTALGLLRRSDGAELAAEVEQDLASRGRLVLDRYAAAPPAHLEVLARHVAARRAAADDV